MPLRDFRVTTQVQINKYRLYSYVINTIFLGHVFAFFKHFVQNQRPFVAP